MIDEQVIGIDAKVDKEKMMRGKKGGNKSFLHNLIILETKRKDWDITWIYYI